MNPKYEPLFTPFKIGEVEIPNRIVQCSMGGTTLFGWLEPSHFDLEGADFLLKRAKDGVGLVLPGMQVIRDTMGRKWLDSNRQMYRVLKPYMDEYHKTGGKLFIQLAGRRLRPQHGRHPLDGRPRQKRSSEQACQPHCRRAVCLRFRFRHAEPLGGQSDLPSTHRGRNPGDGLALRRHRQEAA